MPSSKVYQPQNLGPITAVTIKVLGDFETEFLAGKEKVSLSLEKEEIAFLLESEDFKEKVSQKTFLEYMRYVFKNSLEEFRTQKVPVERKTLKIFEKMLGVSVENYYGYSYYILNQQTFLA